jgi:hypothetical protein
LKNRTGIRFTKTSITEKVVISIFLAVLVVLNKKRRAKRRRIGGAEDIFRASIGGD